MTAMRAEHPVLGQLQPAPLEPEQVLAGDPRTSELTLAATEDGAESAGLWRCTRGSFTDVEVEESFLVICGRATVRYENGTEFELVPGSVHRFAGGERTTWVVEETILKAFWVAE
jgi:uncharacterized protein